MNAQTNGLAVGKVCVYKRLLVCWMAWSFFLVSLLSTSSAAGAEEAPLDLGKVAQEIMGDDRGKVHDAVSKVRRLPPAQGYSLLKPLAPAIIVGCEKNPTDPDGLLWGMVPWIECPRDKETIQRLRQLLLKVSAGKSPKDDYCVGVLYCLVGTLGEDSRPFWPALAEDLAAKAPPGHRKMGALTAVFRIGKLAGPSFAPHLLPLAAKDKQESLAARVVLAKCEVQVSGGLIEVMGVGDTYNNNAMLSGLILEDQYRPLLEHKDERVRGAAWAALGCIIRGAIGGHPDSSGVSDAVAPIVDPRGYAETKFPALHTQLETFRRTAPGNMQDAIAKEISRMDSVENSIKATKADQGRPK